MYKNVTPIQKLQKWVIASAMCLVTAMPNAFAQNPDPAYSPVGQWPTVVQRSSVVGPTGNIQTVYSGGPNVVGFTRVGTSSECFNSAATLNFDAHMTTPPAGYTFVGQSVVFSWKGGLTGAPSGNSITVNPVITANANRNKGRVYAKYVANYQYTFSQVVTVVDPCTGLPTTQNVTITIPLDIQGEAYVDLYQTYSPVWVASIVGPECVNKDDEVTYSIKELVSSNVSDGIGVDDYYWRFPDAWTFKYNSGDNSSITVKASTLNTTDEIFVQVGRCNTKTVSLKIRQPFIPQPVTTTVCGSNSVTFPLTPTAGVTYLWDIAADGKGHTYNGASNNNTQGSINVNLAGTGDGYVELTSSVSASGSCPAASRVDKFNYTRAFTSAVNQINGPSCVAKGGTYTYSVTNATSVNWTFPTGFTITSTDPHASTVTVSVSNTYAGGGDVKASNGNALCASIWGEVAIWGIQLAPTTPVLISGPTCVTPGTAVTYSVVNQPDKLVWTFPAGYNPSTVSWQSSVTVTPSATPGQITVAAEPTWGACPASAPLVINVSPKITPVVSNNGPVCAGTSLVVSAQPVSGATYSWTGPNGFTSTDQSPEVSPSAAAAMAGTYTLTVTVNGCTGNPASTTATVVAKPATPTASSNGPICEGLTLNLTAFVAGGTGVFSWSGPNGFTSNLANPSITNVTPANAGIYTVTLTENGCTSDSATVTVVINSTGRVLAINKISTNDYDQLVATPGFTNYVWTRDGVVIQGENTAYLTLEDADPNGLTHNYCVSGQRNGCVAAPTCQTSIFNPGARIAPATSNSTVSVYPNPAEHEINISIDESLIGVAYQISTLDGVKVRKSTFTSSPEKVNVDGWAAGTYLLTYSVDGKLVSSKFIVK